MTSSTTDRRLGLTGGTAIKAPCLAATTTNITLSGTQTIDSVSVVAGNRVLVKNQTSGTDNGIYVADTGTWTRDLDFDGSNDCVCGTLVFVTNGSANGAGLFQLTTADPITIGSTALTFTKIATLAASSVTQANVQNGQFFECSTIAGTNTITGATVGTAPASLGHGQFVFFIPANTNTGAATFNRDTLGAVAIQYNGAALIGGELQAGVEVLLFHDGTVYELMATSVGALNFKVTGSISASSTLVLDTAQPYTQVTGNTGITGITLGNGRIRICEFSGTPTITNGASLICVGGSNVTMAAGDVAIFAGEAAGVVRMVILQRATGVPSNQSNGIWTPTVAGATTPGSQTYLTQSGIYQKIGNLVFASYNVALSNKDAATVGSLLISGLPVTAGAGGAAANPGSAIGQFGNMLFSSTAFTQLTGYISTSFLTSILIQECGPGAAVPPTALLSSAALTTNFIVSGTVVYQTT